jgi:hypothetical protein
MRDEIESLEQEHAEVTEELRLSLQQKDGQI